VFFKKCVILFILLALSISLLLLPISAANENGDDYDYSRLGSVHNLSLNSAELLTLLLGEELSEQEYSYLEKHGGVTVKYENGMTTAQVITEYNDETKELSVYAGEYSYTAVNGSTVTWIPRAAYLLENSQPLNREGDVYVTVFENVSPDDSLSINVEYSFDFSVSPEAINSVINKAFDDAKLFKEEIAEREEEYAKLKAQYDSEVLAYNEYLEAVSRYEADYAAYTEYLSSKRKYEDALSDYNAYLEAYSNYENKMSDYNDYCDKMELYEDAYSEYQTYLKLLDRHTKQSDAYKTYLDKISVAESQLKYIDVCYDFVTSYKRSVYTAIYSGVVTDVLVEDKDTLVKRFRASEKAVDMAGECTENLRILLVEYKERTTVKDKYLYYAENYEALRDNFTNLLRALDNLYQNKSVRESVALYERAEKYEILVAQLYYVSLALNEGVINNLNDGGYISAYTIGQGYKLNGRTPLQILENQSLVIKTVSAVPLAEGYPKVVEDPGDAPIEVNEPTMPETVIKPDEPEEVDNPGEPPVVVEEPQEPAAVDQPGDEPNPFIPSEDALMLVEAYDSGILSKRESYLEDKTVSLYHTVNKKIFNVEAVTVTFLNSNGSFLYSITVDSGTRASYSGIIPEKAEDEIAKYSFSAWQDSNGEVRSLDSVSEDMLLYPYFAPTYKYKVDFYGTDGSLLESKTVYEGNEVRFEGIAPIKEEDERATYTFSGWQDPKGNAVSLEAVTSHLSLHPRFDANLKKYTVKFSVDGNVTEYTVEYGATPSFDGKTEKPDDELYEYTFVGWDKELAAVDGDAEYVALFEKTYLVAVNGEGGKVSYSDRNIIVDLSGKTVSRLDISKILERAMLENGRGVVLNTDDYSIIISFSNVAKMTENGIISLTTDYCDTSSGFSFYVSLNGCEREIQEKIKLSVTFKIGETDISRCRLYTEDESGNRSYTSFVYGENGVAANIYSDVKYIFMPEYEVGILSTELAQMQTNVFKYAPGQTVIVDYSVPNGVKIDKLFYICNGVEFTFEGNEFIMPEGDVRIGVVASYIEYEIKFVSGDKVITSGKYHYGDKVIVPMDPQKARDDKFTYTFTGWSPEITIVTEDMTYVAEYESKEIPPVVDDGEFHMSERLEKMLTAAIIVAVVIVVVVIPGIAIMVSTLSRRY